MSVSLDGQSPPYAAGGRRRSRGQVVEEHRIPYAESHDRR